MCRMGTLVVVRLAFHLFHGRKKARTRRALPVGPDKRPALYDGD